MRKAYKSRIKMTRTGKLKRRKMGVNHFKSKNSSRLKQNKRKQYGLGYPRQSLVKKVAR